MPQKSEQPFTQELDDKLLNLVAMQLKYQGQVNGVPKYYQANKSSVPQINWQKIDHQLGVDPYQSKARSQHRFFSVLLPNSLPEYDLQFQKDISDYISKQLEEHQLHINSLEQTGRDTFRKELEARVKETFKLSANDLFSYKKLVDRNRHQIINFMKKLKLQTENMQSE
ncbi:Hypothetical_protein [Hexamita inflata]|uniref:Hypothetical_protein n=1 Tax=Hexamita inflata TaxID=28002 RepID=A0AA86QCD2_9EUKA|nr:Hypothetical protein HINF_LOCUS44131 [Hexamita inflata]CAI9956491.1 Hypothetical protein HINF_LOCUS44136 [Hexamita inflata]